MRWSSPLKFNDPFDHQVGLSFDFNGEQLGQKLLEELEQIIFGGKTKFKQPTFLSNLAIKLSSIKDRLPKREIMDALTAACSESAGKLPNLIDDLNNNLIAHLTHARVLCVSECHDNVVMWSHYGDEHKGVVLKLQCIDEIDNTLLAARKVNYTRELPRFAPLESYIKHITGEEPLDLTALCWEIPFTKHEDWSYEKEWRVHIPLLNEPPGDGYSIYKEDPSVFGAVYLGCLISDDDAYQVIEAVREHIPTATIYRGRKSTRSFSLSFDEL